LLESFISNSLIYVSFVKAPNGYGDLDGAASITNYAASDMEPLLQAADVTTNNYLDLLSTVSAQITKLRLIKVSASQVISSFRLETGGAEGSPMSRQLFGCFKMVNTGVPSGAYIKGVN